jgi:hypothetical protein
MILRVRLNHFFRSFWCIKDVKSLNEKDVKYIDIDALNTDTFIKWAVCSLDGAGLGEISTPSNSVDLSYWNTYKVGINNDNLFELILVIFIDYLTMVGIRNFRTDNMKIRTFC